MNRSVLVSAVLGACLVPGLRAASPPHPSIRLAYLPCVVADGGAAGVHQGVRICPPVVSKQVRPT